MAAKEQVQSVVVPNDDWAQVHQAIGIIAAAFEKIPISLSIINEVDGHMAPVENGAATPPRYKPSMQRRIQHFGPQIEDLVRSGAEVVQAGDWSVVAIWCGPDYPISTSMSSPLSSSNEAETTVFKPLASPLVTEYVGKAAALREKYMPMSATSSSTDAKPSFAPGLSNQSELESDPGSQTVPSSSPQSKVRPFYHLEFLARDFLKPSVAGAVSAVLKPYIARARLDGVPAWLEAATPASVTIYERYGFRVVDTITVGVGRVNAEGSPTLAGEGVTLWAMIYDDHLR